MAHKDICKKFKVRSRNGEIRLFEAVGFLNEGESSINGDEMLRRVALENGGAIGEDDGKFLDECVDQSWSRYLWPYYLATNWRDPDYPRYVRYFYRSGDRWYRYWRSLDRQWDDDDLVVRRCA